MSEREFRSDPKIFVYHEPMLLEVKPVEYVKCEVGTMVMTKNVTFKMAKCEVMEWKAYEPTDEEVALRAAYDYLLGVGCDGSDNHDHGKYIVRLPYGVDEWALTIDGNTMKVAKELPWNKRHKAEKLAKPCEVDLSNPESLPQVLAHMQKHSRFLRGGTSNHIKIIDSKAV